MEILMPYEIVANAKKKFFGSLKMEDWLDYLSIKTWYGLAKSLKIDGVGEETFTDNILMEMCDVMNLLDMPLRIFRSVDEKTNGGDLEIFVPMKNKFVRLAVQAKKVYIEKNYVYDAMPHTVKGSGKLQINLLLDYAKKIRAVPIYLFYNYCEVEVINVKILSGAKRSPPITHFGCSFADANWVKQNFVSGNPEKWIKKPGILDVHPPSRPFSELDNFRKGYSWDALSKILKFKTPEHDVDFIEPDALENTSDWREYRPNPVFKSQDELQRDYISAPTVSSDFIQGRPNEIQESDGFSPKFRMVLERGVATPWNKKSLHLK